MIGLCDLLLVTSATLENSEWTFDTTPIPAQIPEPWVKAKNKMFSHLRSRKIIPYSNSLKFFPPMMPESIGFFGVKRTGRPLLIVMKPREFVEGTHLSDLPPTVTEDYPIDRTAYFSGKVYVDRVKKKRINEIKESKDKEKINYFLAFIEKVFLEIVDKNTVTQLNRMGLSKARAGSLKYESGQKRIRVDEIKLLFWCYDIDYSTLVELMTREKDLENNKSLLEHLSVVRTFEKPDDELSDFI